MTHEQAIQAMDNQATIRSSDDVGRIVALGQYDTSQIADYERKHPLNKRTRALVSWESGVRTWTPIRELLVNGQNGDDAAV